VIRRLAVLVGASTGTVAVVAVPMGLWRGEYQWLCAGVALALTVPPGMLTLLVADRLGQTAVYGPLGPLLALVIGTVGRLFVGFGGAVAVFLFARPTFDDAPLTYWAWVLFAYLTALVVETVLLAGTNENNRATGGTA
jgi:hypothetical protein